MDVLVLQTQYGRHEVNLLNLKMGVKESFFIYRADTT